MKNSLIISVLTLLTACGQSNETTDPKAADQIGDTIGPGADFRAYDAEAFYQTTTFVAPSSYGIAFSPDTKKILVTSDESGVFNVYAMDVDSGVTTQLTHSTTTGNFAASYFPDGERILFTADGGGDELDHLWVREVDGSLRDLTPTENTKAGFSGWRSDGAEFFVYTNERDPAQFDLYAYDSKDYSRRLLYQNNQALQLGEISPDGRWLSLVNIRNSADSDLYLKDLTNDEPAQLITEHEGNINYFVFTFTPDSEAVILATDEHGEFTQAWRYDIAAQSSSAYATADWDVSAVGFSSTGRYRYVAVNADASTEITITDQQTNETMSLPELPQGDIANIRFSRDDKTIAVLISSDSRPRDLFVFSPGSKAKRLTSALNPEINPDHLVEADVVRYESFDGLEIPAVLYKPKQASFDNPVPALVLVHGGPGGQTRRGYNAFVQHLVNNGYAVLGANNRGSSGYGKTFYHLDDKAHGEGDLQDIVWGKKYLQSLNWIDADKIGIIGGSYGGFMVTAALAFEPEEFAVGIDIFGVTNWVRTLNSIPPWWEAAKESLYDEMGDPATDSERHRRISPLFHAENIVKPLLVIQGANDPRVLQVESDELVAAVKANGTPVEYIIFPDEGHGFRNRDNRITASDAYVAFLDKYLSERRE